MSANPNFSIVDPYTGEQMNIGLPDQSDSQADHFATSMVVNWLNHLPAHITVLLANLHKATRSVLEQFGNTPQSSPGKFAYYKHGGSPQLYELGSADHFHNASEEDIKDQDLKINKFGQFWFYHMNLIEVQYLAGYESTKPVSEYKPDYFLDDPGFSSKKGKKYEEVFNSSVKAPVWKPLTVDLASSILNIPDEQSGEQNHILCRIVKKKYDFFNAKAYEALDLPMYNEYFLITTEKQVGGENYGIFKFNAYVQGFPTDKISASSPGLQMVKKIIKDLPPTMGIPLEFIGPGEETEEIEIGEVDL